MNEYLRIRAFLTRLIAIFQLVGNDNALAEMRQEHVYQMSPRSLSDLG